MLVQAPVAGGAMIQQQMIVPGAPQSHVVQQQQQQQARPAAAGFVFSGIGHFCSHPALWLYALCPLCCGIIGIAIMIPIILATLFVPQHDWMMSWWGCDGGMCSAGAYFVALMLCLAEIAIGAIAFLQIALGFLMGEVFVKTMKDLGVWQGELASCGQQCTDALWWVMLQVVAMICLLPLHLFPVLGTLVYCAINGALLAWEYHELYFNMHGIPKHQQRHEVLEHWQDYASFGVVANLMLLVPFIGPFTFVTSVCGAACWAAELEKRGCRPKASRVVDGEFEAAAPMPNPAAGTAPAVESRGVLQRMGPVDAGLGAAPQIIQQPAPGFAPAAGQPVQPQLMQPQVLQQPQPIQAQVVQAAVVPQQQPQMMMVTVPPGLQPGQMFAFTNLSGQSMQMAVPAGVFGGQQIQVQG